MNRIKNTYLKFIFKLLLILSLIIVFDYLIGAVLSKLYFKQTSGLFYRTTYAMDSAKADIVIFGSSRANHHYVPEIFEDSLKMTYYNTGRDGNGIFYQIAVLKSIINRYTPKIIILDYYDVTSYNTSDYDRLASLLPYYNNHPEIRSIIEKRSKYENLKLLSKIYPYNSMLLSILVGNMEFNKKRKSDNMGYIQLSKVWNYSADTLHYKNAFQVDSLKLNALTEFIGISRKAGVKIYVVYSPIFQLQKKNYDIEIGLNICNSANVRFLDYSKDTAFLNGQLFQDISHLNHNGAIKFTNLLINQIKCEYVN